jgi:hypothetical protein
VPETLDWDNMLLGALAWEIGPSEFWQMTMAEWFLIYEAHRDRETLGKTKLTRKDAEELLEWTLNGAAPS